MPGPLAQRFAKETASIETASIETASIETSSIQRGDGVSPTLVFRLAISQQCLTHSHSNPTSHL